MEGVKEATYTVGDVTVKVAVVNGIKNAKQICEQVKQGNADYQFIEVMTCPGGCVMGGGQPIRDEYVKTHDQVQQARASVLYDTDKACDERRSHQNKSLAEVYEQYLGEPNGHTAHEVLHTTYKAKTAYVKE